jgi:predicted nicotinamide N-methyase
MVQQINRDPDLGKSNLMHAYLNYTLHGYEDGQPFERELSQTLDRWAAQSATIIDVTLSCLPIKSLSMIPSPSCSEVCESPSQLETWAPPKKKKNRKQKKVLNGNAVDPAQELTLASSNSNSFPETIKLKLHQQAKIFIGGQIWDTSFILACWIMSQTKLNLVKWHGRQVCEVGAGIGFLSLVLSALGARVTATDMEEVIPILELNYKENSHVTLNASCMNDATAKENMRVLALDWRFPDVSQFTESFDYIIACDCIYSEASTIDLVHCLVKLCETSLTHAKAHHSGRLNSGGPTVYVVSEMRNKEVQDVFLEAAQRTFTVTFKNIEQDIYPYLPESLQTSRIVFYEMKLREGV